MQRWLTLLILTAALASACAGAGPGGRRPMVVMVHGWASDARVWSDVQERLHSSALALNLPGHGQPQAAGEVSMHGFAAAIEAARRAADARCILIVAHSNGAYAARQYVRDYPGFAEALVIVEGTFIRPYDDAAAFERNIDAVASNWAALQERPLGLEGASAQTSARVRLMLADVARDTAIESLRALLDPSLWADDQVVEPVTFVQVESPVWNEAERVRLRQVAPNSRFVTIRDSSHWAPLDAPDAVADVINNEVLARTCSTASGATQ